MATYSSILAWEIPWTEEPVRLQSMGMTESWTQLSDFHFHFPPPVSDSLAPLSDIAEGGRLDAGSF